MDLDLVAICGDVLMIKKNGRLCFLCHILWLYIYIYIINLIPIGWLLSGDIVTGAIMVV